MEDFKQLNMITSEQKSQRKLRYENLEGFHLKDSTDTYTSPCGKYTAVISYHTRAPEYPSGYSLAKIYKEGHMLGEILRAYLSFPFQWVCDHPDGNDYFVCAEAVDTQTLVNLTTQTRTDVQDSGNFIWAHFMVSPCKTLMCVEGCYWGAEYNYRVYDFSTPGRNFTTMVHTTESDSSWYNKAQWEGSTLKFSYFKDFCPVLDKWEDEVTIEELEDLYKTKLSEDTLWEEREVASTTWSREL